MQAPEPTLTWHADIPEDISMTQSAVFKRTLSGFLIMLMLTLKPEVCRNTGTTLREKCA